MAGLKLNHIYKVYPNGTKAVSDFTMDIADKEFIIFVGPSGCGKSTTLRMIAGLEEITTGVLTIDDVTVNNIEPKDRDIAMVFQNYALYPHMTVYKNMAFGLKLRKIPDVKKDKEGNDVLNENGEPVMTMRHYTPEEIDVRVKEAAEILGITEYLNKKPGEMSGGQRQRVALGRAIVREPKVFLLDEPLSNLDAKLRTQMRSEILKLHRRLQTTFIYVTHDQIEAMTMGTRIVVMKDGFVQQIDTPRNLYNYPCNKFVAGFIGTPQMNFFTGKLKKEGNKVRMTLEGTDVDFLAEGEYFTKINPVYLDGEKPVTVGIRSEHISYDAKAYPYKAKCRISHYEDLGTDCLVYGDFNTENADNGDSPTKMVMKAPAGSVYNADDIVEVSFDLSHMHFFDAETEKTIAPRIPEISVVDGVVSGNTLSVLGAQITLPSAINLADGNYGVHIPPEAIKVYKRAKAGLATAQFEGEEAVNNLKLLKLTSGESVLYALADGEETFTAGAKVYLNFDLKLLSFYAGNEEKQAALSLDNMVKGQLVKRKMEEMRTDENGKTVREKGFVIDLIAEGYQSQVPDEFGLKLLSCGDSKKIFNSDLEFHFSPYSVKVAELGFTAIVEKVLDYGEEKFAVCVSGEHKFTVAADLTEGETVTLELVHNELSVFDPVQEIKLV